MLNKTDLEAWEYYNETYKNKDMSLNEYQNAAAKTAVYKTAHQILYPALGLAGEAGEVANKVKKMLRDNDFDRDAIVAEIGDVPGGISNAGEGLGPVVPAESLHHPRRPPPREIDGGEDGGRTTELEVLVHQA